MTDLHRLHWRIWIDWNNNGTWAETSGAYREDITADVLDLDWRWGQPVVVSANPRRPRPAQLQLTLGNEDRRYTPGNAQSPLSGNLAASRRVWAAFAWPYDGFCRGRTILTLMAAPSPWATWPGTKSPPAPRVSPCPRGGAWGNDGNRRRRLCPGLWRRRRPPGLRVPAQR